MDSNHDQQTSSRDKGCSDKKHEEGKLDQLKQPSASSSPSHEFSFTISLHSSTIPDKAQPAPSFAIDLSPADDIFFHGHLLPLHLLSHLPASPRSSINSTDSFTLPVKDLLREDHDQRPTKETNNQSSSNININTDSSSAAAADDDETRARSSKTKSYSLLGFITRWRSKRDEDNKEKQKRKLMRVDVRQVVKKYVRMVQQPLFFFKGRRESMQPYSLSGNLAFRDKPGLRGRRGEFSAPASMRTSPSNSGLLVATETALPSSKTDSTMEDLHAAIQAAIAHCKNSNIAAHDIDRKLL